MRPVLDHVVTAANESSNNQRSNNMRGRVYTGEEIEVADELEVERRDQ